MKERDERASLKEVARSDRLLMKEGHSKREYGTAYHQ